MPGWSTVVAADVTGAWIGDNAPTDADLINVWIGKAEREIVSRVPDIEARIAAEATEDPVSTALLADAKDVVVAMVIRVFRNPDNVRQSTTTTGPFSESRTVGGDNPGSLELTSDEVKKLSGSGSGRAYEINLIPSTSKFA
jgi:hypothetical protein